MNHVESRHRYGVLYYANGPQYLAEATRSCTSVRATMPGIAVAIASDQPVDTKLFDIVLPAPAEPVKRQKMKVFLETPFERTLFLDTDTLLLSAIWEVFDVLENFDAAMTLAPGYDVSADPSSGRDRMHDGVPAAYPRWNSGVVAFRNNEPWRDLVQEWYRVHCEGPPEREDQPSLRVAAYGSSARIAPLPYAYNFRLPFPGGIRGAVKVLHGRDPELAQMVRGINRNLDLRAIIPRRFLRGMIVHGSSALAKSVRKRWRKLAERANAPHR